MLQLQMHCVCVAWLRVHETQGEPPDHPLLKTPAKTHFLPVARQVLEAHCGLDCKCIDLDGQANGRSVNFVLWLNFGELCGRISAVSCFRPLR